MLNTHAMIQGIIIMVVRRSTRPEESAAVDTQTGSLRSEPRQAPRPPLFNFVVDTSQHFESHFPRSVGFHDCFLPVL